MASGDVTVDDLAEAIERNPDEVARFVDRLDLVNELLDVVALGRASMDDRMVATLAERSTHLAASADGLATAETARLADRLGADGDELEAALETLVDLQRSGTLDDLADAASLLSLAMAAADDEMIASFARLGTELGAVADAAGDPDAARGIETMLVAVAEASDPSEPPAPTGAIGLVRSLRDPDVKRGLGFLIAIAGALGHELDRNGDVER